MSEIVRLVTTGFQESARGAKVCGGGQISALETW